jgi:hypothetical protein
MIASRMPNKEGIEVPKKIKMESEDQSTLRCLERDMVTCSDGRS